MVSFAMHHYYITLTSNSCDYKADICGLSIIALNGTYVKYYPSRAISLSRPHLQPSTHKFLARCQAVVIAPPIDGIFADVASAPF